MEFQPASFGSLAVFVGILVTVSGSIAWMIGHACKSPKGGSLLVLALAAWLGALALVVQSGRMTSLPLDGLPLFFGPIILFWTALAFSTVGGRIAATVPLALLVGFQAFRLPLELVLHAWANQGVIPATMTWNGQNWDIISGILALVAAPLATRYPAIVRITNIVGFALLLNVMRVAVLSSPVPFGWGVQPPLLLAFHLPYAFIGPVCVGGALFGHIVLTRALWRMSSSSTSVTR